MRTFLIWTASVMLTLGLAFYQESTGPTKAVRGMASVGGTTFTYKLLRTHGGEGGLPVVLRVADPAVGGEVIWRRYPTQETWQTLPLVRKGESLEAEIPHQPPAGKVEYEVRVRKGGDEAAFPPRTAVARFKGEVNPVVLIVHIFMMFFGMLWSARTALEALLKRPRCRFHAWVAFHLLFVGGLILGPVVQYQAFGAFWTGAPFGYDLTDNKTLIAVVAWGIALWILHFGRNARWWVFAAAILTLAIFVIPHSVLGSQIDWTKMPPPH
jgi:hypothetical protein